MVIPPPPPVSDHCHVGPVSESPGDRAGKVDVALRIAVATVPTATGSGTGEPTLAETVWANAVGVLANRIRPSSHANPLREQVKCIDRFSDSGS